MRKLSLFISLILLFFIGFGQNLISADDHLINGFEKK
jgi:hypothetical protein